MEVWMPMLCKTQTFLGAARNVENGGSLVLLLSLTETGSKMDEVILRNSKVLVIWNCNRQKIVTNVFSRN
jgi:transcription termination factor Rho